MLVQLALVVSIGLNILTCLVLANQRRKVSVVMTANADALNALHSDVQNESSVVDSAIVLINGLANRLTDILSQSAGTEDLTSQIQALRDEINNRSVALGQAVAAGSAAENDSSSFPTVSPPATTNDQSTETTSSDTSAGDTTVSDSSSGSDATPAPDTSVDAGVPASPAGDGTADVAPPSAGDNLDTGPDSPPAVETAGDEVVVPDNGDSVPDEGDGA